MSRTVIKGVANLLSNSWTRCWSFSFIWRFCCFQIRKFHIRHVKSQNLPPIRMPNIRISWDVGQQKRLFCSSLLTSLFEPTTAGLFFHRFSGIDWKWNFRNLEFRGKILEFRRKFLHFHGGNSEFPLSLDEKSLSLENFLSLDCLEFSENRWKNEPANRFGRAQAIAIKAS